MPEWVDGCGFGWQNKIICRVFSFQRCKCHLCPNHVPTTQTFVKVDGAAEMKVDVDFCCFAFGFRLGQV